MERKDFTIKMQQVAELLNMLWEENSINCNMGNIIGANQENILCKQYFGGGRINIMDQYPRDEAGNYYSTNDNRVEISVSETKPAEKIAQEIQRRFLPRYLENLKYILQRIERSNTYDKAQKEGLQLIADHFKKEVSKEKKVIYLYSGNIHKIESCTDRQVRMDVRCTPEQCIKIIELLEGKQD